MGKNRACTGRTRYPDRATATAAAHSHRRRHAALRIDPYACKHCGGWHIGHRPRGRR